MFRLPGQVAPQSSSLLVSEPILAIGHIGPLQVRHEGSALEQARLRILNAPEGRAQVPDQLQSSDGRAVAFLELARPARQRAAVLGAGRRGPDHVKVARREHRHGFQLHTSAQMVDPALGSTSRLTTSQPSSAKALPTDPVPENSSSKRGILVFHVRLEGQPDHRSEGGAAASELQVAEGAFPEGLRARRLVLKEPRMAAPESRWASRQTLTLSPAASL